MKVSNSLVWVSSLVCLALFIGCKYMNSRQETGKTLTLEDLKVLDTHLSFRYKVTNTSDRDIWICRDIDLYGDIDQEVTVDKGKVRVRCAHVTVPAGVHLEAAIVAQYIKLSPGGSYSDTILLPVPVCPVSPLMDPLDIESPCEATALSFEIGYFTDNLRELGADVASKEDRRHTGSDASRSVAGYNDDHVGAVANIGHHRTAILKREKMLKTDVHNLRIPCLQPGKDGKPGTVPR